MKVTVEVTSIMGTVRRKLYTLRLPKETTIKAVTKIKSNFQKETDQNRIKHKFEFDLMKINPRPARREPRTLPSARDIIVNYCKMLNKHDEAIK